MFTGFSYSDIYNSIEKIETYWQDLKPITSLAPNADKWREQDTFFRQLSYHNSTAIMIWDIIKNRFIYVADETGVLGHQACFFTKEDGVDFSLSNFHPYFLNALLTLQKHGVEYCMKNPEYNTKIILSCDNMYKRADGTCFKLMQQAVIAETDSTGQPLVFLSYIHDITHLKKVSASNLVIKAPNEVQILNYNFERQKIDEPYYLTPQETKVLLLLSQGKQTKEIATALFCSHHTIDTHRRNLLKKTNCINTTALVSYARMTGLI